jgi:rubredoxin
MRAVNPNSGGSASLLLAVVMVAGAMLLLACTEDESPTRTDPNSDANAALKADPIAPDTPYTCNVCGYVYEPAKGDVEHGVDPCTPFAELPEGWTCPDCGAPPSFFTPGMMLTD